LGKIYKAFEKSNLEKSDSYSDIKLEEQTDDRPEHKENNRSVPTDDISLTEPDLVEPDGNFSKNSNNIDASLVTIIKPHSVASEQFRLLKNNILFPEKGVPPRSIMVTSPSPNEGKSFVAANLAVSIAQSIDEYVLLVDCDLRSPTIHRLFGQAETQGLSDYLSTAKPLSSMLLKTLINKLTILPGGKIAKNPSELLSSEQMRRLIDEVKLRYSDRYVIIDTPPPYITSETSALARHVDGIIVVIQQGKTRKKDVQNIIDIYGKEKIIGVVQNFAKKGPGYGYGYYKYGYGYSK